MKAPKQRGSTKLVVGKLEGAKRQLETAIRLYFNYDDPVSIHTLAAAAYGVIQGVNKKKTGEMMLKDMVWVLGKKEGKEAHKQLNYAENFFKHGSADSEATCELNPGWTEVLLFEACNRYARITSEVPALMHLFYVWFVVTHDAVFRKHDEFAIILDKVDLRAVPSDRREYFEGFAPLVLSGAITSLPNVAGIFSKR